MLNPIYKRNLNNNYLIIEEDEKKNYGYETKMILSNSIPKFLPCNVQMINGKYQYEYEVSGKQSLSNICQVTQIEYEVLKNILLAICHKIDSLCEYLLEETHLILHPNYLYLDAITKEIEFVYYPHYAGDTQDEFRKLTEFFLNSINHTDERAVVLAYQVYKYTREENYSLKEILEHTLLEKNTQIDEDENVQEEFYIAEEKAVNYEGHRDTQKWKYKNSQTYKKLKKNTQHKEKKEAKDGYNDEESVYTLNLKLKIFACVSSIVCLLWVMLGELLARYMGLSEAQFIILTGVFVMLFAIAIVQILLSLTRQKVQETDTAQPIKAESVKQGDMEGVKREFVREEAYDMEEYNYC